jgi:hypothetical protein
MKNRQLEVARLFVVTLVAIWVLQGGSAASTWASGLANVAAAPDIAAIPNAFSYQGTLRLADGSLPTGSYNITLKIYNVVSGGTALHSESFTDTVVRNGNFSIIVGDVTPIAAGLFDNAKLYIGVTVAPDPEMLPRQRLYPVPWAMQASQAATANAATTATTATTAATATTLIPNATVNGGLTVNGGVTVDPGFGGWRIYADGTNLLRLRNAPAAFSGWVLTPMAMCLCQAI